MTYTLSGLWQADIGDGERYTVRLPAQSKSAAFGVRDFGSDENGRLALNGRAIFLRGEANCAEFPETSYCPMGVEDWMGILETYRSYGINCMRFHSHCPPEAAFTAADRLGILMEPELSHGGPHQLAVVAHGLAAGDDFAQADRLHHHRNGQLRFPAAHGEAV